MNYAALMAMIFQLAPVTVLTIEKLHGDKVAGADKKAMAKDALDGATAGALSVLNGNNAAYAQAASDAAKAALSAAVIFTRKTGAYQAATAQAQSVTPAQVPAALPPNPAS